MHTTATEGMHTLIRAEMCLSIHAENTSTGNPRIINNIPGLAGSLINRDLYAQVKDNDFSIDVEVIMHVCDSTKYRITGLGNVTVIM